MNQMYRLSRWLLGLCFVVFGINGFGPWLPIPELAPKGQAFMQALMDTGYMLPFWKITEIVTGLCFLANRWVIPASIIAMPVSLNIFAFHAFLDRGGFVIGALILVFNLIVLLHHKDRLAPLFAAKT